MYRCVYGHESLMLLRAAAGDTLGRIKAKLKERCQQQLAGMHGFMHGALDRNMLV